tara:strand:- start:2413 stop:2616 length:204 start_codon:yes stop_codon:yes gene_type:complete
MKSIIVFGDSHESDGFEKTVGLLNELLTDLPSVLCKGSIKINYVFLEDFVSDAGEYAFHVWFTGGDE